MAFGPNIDQVEFEIIGDVWRHPQRASQANLNFQTQKLLSKKTVTMLQKTKIIPQKMARTISKNRVFYYLSIVYVSLFD